jgi:hypothetical protein
MIEILLVLFYLASAILIFIHISRKLRKGGELTTTMLGATDLFYDIEKKIANAEMTTEVLLILPIESEERVDEGMSKVLSVGRQEQWQVEGHGFMYGGTFEDLDNHIREVFWMDPGQMGNDLVYSKKVAWQGYTADVPAVRV